MAKAIPNSARMVAEEGRSCQGHSTCEEGDSERTSSNSATGERAWTVMCCSGKAVSFGPIPHDILKSGGRAPKPTPSPSTEARFPQCTVFQISIERWADGHFQPFEANFWLWSSLRGLGGSISLPAWKMQHFEVCHMSVGWKVILPHFLVSYVFTLKMHKNDLEKNRRHSQIMSLLSRGTLTHPDSPCKVPFPTSSDIFFYRLRQ